MSFANSAFPVTIPGTVDITLAIMGIGAITAVIGGIMFVTIVLVSILTGERKEPAQLLLVTGKHNPLVESASAENHRRRSARQQSQHAQADDATGFQH